MPPAVGKTSRGVAPCCPCVIPWGVPWDKARKSGTPPPWLRERWGRDFCPSQFGDVVYDELSSDDDDTDRRRGDRATGNQRHEEGEEEPFLLPVSTKHLYITARRADSRHPRELDWLSPQYQRVIGRVISLSVVALPELGSLEQVPAPESPVYFNWTANSRAKVPLLSACKTVRRVDLSAHVSLKEVGNKFFSDCGALEEILLPPPAPPTALAVGSPATHRSKEVLDRWERLVGKLPIRMTKKSKTLRCMTSNMLACAVNMRNHITRIGSHFLSNCNSLVRLDLSALCFIKEIPDHFLSGCSSLKEICCGHNGLSAVERIGGSFLFGCTSLTNELLRTMTLSLCRLQEIGPLAFNCSTQITHIDLRRSRDLKTIGPNFSPASHSSRRATTGPKITVMLARECPCFGRDSESFIKAFCASNAGKETISVSLA